MKSLSRFSIRLASTALALACARGSAQAGSTAPVAVGSRLQLFVDDFLVERIEGQAELRLQHPVPQEVALETSEPWEGNATNYVTVFRDGEIYRMYYRGGHYSYLGGKDRPTHRDVYCYAESPDGIHWVKPELGIFSWGGSKRNNIILDGIGTHAFAPFRDANPRCMADARYKALGWSGVKEGLYAFKSTDGIHWALMSPDPVITQGAFDSLNLAFWDAERGEYREYHRDFRDTAKAVDRIGYSPDQGRDIRTASSPDFLHWTEPEFLSYVANVDLGRCRTKSAAATAGGADSEPSGRVSELYTSQIAPYYRAPDLLLGFPTRYNDRGWTEATKALPRYDYRVVRASDATSGRREGTAVTDGMFMTSRDRKLFSIWPESFIRPGLRTRDTWFYGDIYQNWGLVETKSAFEDGPPELSIYVTERTLRETGAVIRRYTLRIDGFVSLHAPLAGGELVTKPLSFAGNRLMLNAGTSGAGSVRVEIQDIDGYPLPGFALADCHEFYGDSVEATVAWRRDHDLGSLVGKPVRLRFVLKDADIYSIQFK